MFEINKYPDGSSYASVNREDKFTFKINDYNNLWELNQIVDAKNSLGITPVITIPWLIDSQADRRFGKEQSHGLKLVCHFLNEMKAEFIIFHPHNPSLVEALMKNVTIINNKDFIHKVIFDRLLSKGQDLNNLILMSSDAGGFKPLMELCDELPWRGETYSASKARSVNQWKLKQFIDREDFNKKDILIIDDLSIYGGTFKGLSKLLKERNCGKLFLAVSTITVQDLGEDPVTNYFDTVFTTNNKYDEYIGVEKDNLDILKLF